VTLYVDSSALVKRYVAEDGSDRVDAILLADPDWVTGGQTYVEVSLALQRRLGVAEHDIALDAFEQDWPRTFVVALDEVVIRRAAALGMASGSRSLDALHMADAERAGGRSMPVSTFDVRLAHAVRSLGFTIVGE
jgi:hypothetical protein